MTAMLRWFIFSTLAVAMMLASSRDTGWQTGAFRIEGSDNEGWNSFGVAAARRAPGKQSDDPLSETLVFDINYEGGSYRGSITGLAIDRSVSYDELFPWLRDVPSQVRFRIKQNTIYFLDSKNKLHKADIIPSPQPHSSRKQ
jgi:hypothetical protein